MNSHKKSLNTIIIGILVISFVLAAVLGVMGLINSDLLHNPNYYYIFFACGIMFVPNIVSYFLNKRGFYYPAAIILIFSIMVAIFFSDAPSSVLASDNILLFSVPIFLSGILLFPSSSWIAVCIIAVPTFFLDKSVNHLNFIQIAALMFIIALITWITAWSRERLEKVLRTRERSHKMLFDSSSNPIIIRKPDGTVIDANDAASSFLGYAYEEITKMNAKSWYLSEDEWKKVSKEIAYQTVNQSTYEVLTTYVPKNGEKIRVNLTGNVLKRNGESLYQTIIKPLDSREMEQELHQSQIKYRTLIDSVDGIVWVILREIGLIIQSFSLNTFMKMIEIDLLIIIKK